MNDLKSNTTNTKLWRYLLDELAKPRPEIGGMAICPFIKRFERQIIIRQTDNPWLQIQEFPELSDVYDIQALVLWGFTETHGDVDSMCADYTQRISDQDVTVLSMNPAHTESPLPIQYTWQAEPLLIVQRTSVLEKYQEYLQENTDYYGYFRADD